MKKYGPYNGINVDGNQEYEKADVSASVDRGISTIII